MRELFYFMGAAAIIAAELVASCAKDNYTNASLREFPMFGRDSSSLKITIPGPNGRVLKTDGKTYQKLQRAAMKKRGDGTGRGLPSFRPDELKSMIWAVADEADATRKPYGIITSDKIAELNIR